MRMTVGLFLVLLPMVARAAPQPCAKSDLAVLEVSLQIGTTYDISEKQREEVCEKVGKRLEDLLPFLVLVQPSDQPHLRIELATNRRLLVNRDEEPPEGEGYPVVGEEPWAEVTFTRITCQDEPDAYKDCLNRVKIAQRLATEKGEMEIDDPSELIEFFVEVITQKVCALYGTAPN